MFRLRKMQESDVSFFNQTRNECREFLHDNSYYSYEQSLEWFRSKNPNFYILELNNEKIGYFRTSINEDNELYIGADINTKYRGKGHAKEAYQMFMDLIKIEYEGRDLYLEVFESNTRAHNLYKKLGFFEINRYNLQRGISIKMKKSNI